MNILHNLRSMAALAVAIILLGAVMPGAQASPPVNDSFARATPLNTYTPVAFTYGTNLEATTEADEPAATGASSVWFSWVATSSTAVFSTLGSDFNTTLSMYEGTAVNALTPVLPAPGPNLFESLPAPYNGDRQFTFQVVQGHTYLIAVGGAVTAPGQRPEQGTIVLSWVGTDSSPSTYNPVLLAARSPVYATPGQANVKVPVFRLFKTDSLVTVTPYFYGVTATASDYAPLGQALSFAPGDVVAYAQFNALAQPHPLAGPDRTLGLSLVNAYSAAGYTLQGYGNSLAAVILNSQPPVNDSLANATVLTGSAGSAPFSNWGAGAETGEAAVKYGPVRSVWFSWTAPQDGNVTFRNVQGVVGPVTLYTGTAVASLTPVAGGSSKLDISGGTAYSFRTGTWPVTAGTTYQLLVDDGTGAATTGTGGLAWAMGKTGDFGFATATVTTLEAVGTATLTVRRGTSSTDAATLSYAFLDAEAVAGTDYDATPGTVSFAAGELSKDITVPVMIHTGALNRSFFVILAPGPGSPQAAIDPATAVARVRISSNDLLFNAFALPSSSASGTVHGSTLLSTVNRGTGDTGEPVHGSPASLTSVWYTLIPRGGGVTTFTCAQGLVEVYDARHTPVAASFYDTAANAWRCTVYPDPSTTAYPLYICISNPGGVPGPFDLKWEPGSSLSWREVNIAVEGTPLQVQINRNGTTGFSALSPELQSMAVVTVTAVGKEYWPYPAATAGVDFDGSPHTVIFMPGETSKTVSIDLYRDHVHEVAEHLTLQLACTQGNAAPQPPYTSYPDIILHDTDPYVPVAGTYSALLNQNSHVNVTVSPLRQSNGQPGARITGVLTYGGRAYRFSTLMNSVGIATASFTGIGAPPMLTISSTEGGASLVFSIGIFTPRQSVIIGDRQGYDARTNPAPAFGTYTAVLINPLPLYGGQASPANSVATASVSAAGVLTLAGILGDGAAFTSSSPLRIAPNTSNAQAHAVLYVPLYQGKGWLQGDIAFPGTSGTGADFTCTMTWAKPDIPGSRSYPNGFTANPVLTGQRYTAPPHGVRALPGLDSSGTFTLSLGQTSTDTTATVAKCWWLVDNRINTSQFNQPPGLAVNLTVSPGTGLIGGAITSPALKLSTLPVHAVVLQGTADVKGFFLNYNTKDSAPVFRQ